MRDVHVQLKKIEFISSLNRSLYVLVIENKNLGMPIQKNHLLWHIMKQVKNHAI